MRPMSMTLAPTATVTSMTTPTTTTTTTTTHNQLWNSPIPYLFGGLAAMLGLIAFALFILAFSYKRLNGQLQQQNQDGGDRDLEKEGDTQKKEQVKVYEEKILVIMAGDENPTFLATPVCPKSLSLGVDAESSLDKQLGDPKVCDKSQKEFHNDHVVVVESTISTQESQASQQQRRQ